MNKFIKIDENKYVPKIMVDICCNQDVNGEHRLLEKIIEKSSKNSIIFDVGARNSKFPNFSNTHQFHLFDPNFIYEEGVDYEKENVFINNKALNSKDYTLDNYCIEHNIDSIEYLKIDTDGFDIDVLKGSKNMINKTKYIQVEHDMFHLLKKVNLDELYDLLNGFKLYKITPFGLEKADKIKENYIYSNYLFYKEGNEISYDPHELDLDFFKGIFWELPQSYVEEIYKSTSQPFFNNLNCHQFNEKTFLTQYYCQYLVHINES